MRTSLQLRQAKTEVDKGSQLAVGTLDAELEPLVLSKAAQLGLAPAWITRLARLDPQRRQVLFLTHAWLPHGWPSIPYLFLRELQKPRKTKSTYKFWSADFIHPQVV